MALLADEQEDSSVRDAAAAMLSVALEAGLAEAAAPALFRWVTGSGNGRSWLLPQSLARVRSEIIAVEAIGLNAAANGVVVEATAADLLAALPGRFDLVLIGDLFYERPLAERVLAFAEAAKAQGADVLVGDPRRSYFPKEKFVSVANYDVPVTRELEDAEIKRSAVWRLA